jgi:hypothetical protein
MGYFLDQQEVRPKMTEDQATTSRAKGTPEVSVVMCARNAQEWIQESVQSILNQDFESFELIVVDDASTDGTLDVLSQFRDERLIVLQSQTTGGPSAARNSGITKAQGSCIAILDSDDIAVPARLSTQVAFMRANPHIGLCGGWGRTFGDHETIRRFPSRNGPLRAALLFGNPFLHSTVMFRREALPDRTETYLTRLSQAEDYELFTQIAQHWAVANLPRVLAEYRIHSSQITQKQTDEMSSAFTALQTRLLEVALLPPMGTKGPDLRWLGMSVHLAPRDQWVTRRQLLGGWLLHNFEKVKQWGILKARQSAVAKFMVAIARNAKLWLDRRSRP